MPNFSQLVPCSNTTARLLLKYKVKICLAAALFCYMNILIKVNAEYIVYYNNLILHLIIRFLT